ncbi:RsmB/NOP family class I SAM-dependent RNA methyltransferase [Limibaculum sp. FT325]|uniref:RsmB/NOP family class I SAM-dependent RNA methyltransferase n=1 Tax=Thermohalobaculum sediminis TaxID=2939436 RepID=UPI0020BF392F|nr:RsmB/NOP family class I SAM-dependent RNA methyltransferase [Limibaculum sediminis]MCL5775566.1 RsmB/NOP family class I SAM-dependent RNA methyltransferase [Limibaculum sediminis]
MTPGARVAAAIAILDDWLAGGDGADRLLAAWGRASRYAGSGDRQAVADLVYDALRRLRSTAWVAGADTPSGRSALIGSLRLDGRDPAPRFTGEGHAPAPLASCEAPRDLAAAPEAVRLDLPDWLMPHLEAVPRAALEALRHRAPLDLRVNRLKADPPAAVAALAAEGIAAVPGPLAPDCLRVTEGARRVARSRAYLDGLVEIQDAASQAVAAISPPQPGETVLDFCAGGGGKTLALGAAMAGRGRLVAHDISAARLGALRPRAERAGLAVECLPPGATGSVAGACDLVFVDAPCSGSGAWRRNPDAKWRLTPQRLDALIATQDQVLDDAARAVRPGGRLVYATCSILVEENAARVAAFLARDKRFTLEGAPLALLPGEDAGDGFFAAILRRA